jgi:hypothetical protein
MHEWPFVPGGVTVSAFTDSQDGGAAMSVSLNVLSVYSTKDDERIAAQVCDSLQKKLGAAFRMAHSEWNAELLRNEKLRELAALEAVDSDIVILATSDGDELSPEIREWLKSWAGVGQRRQLPAALVALLKRESPDATRRIEKRLEAFANYARMDFFCHSEIVKSRNAADRMTLPLFHHVND